MCHFASTFTVQKFCICPYTTSSYSSESAHLNFLTFSLTEQSFQTFTQTLTTHVPQSNLLSQFSKCPPGFSRSHSPQQFLTTRITAARVFFSANITSQVVFSRSSKKYISSIKNHPIHMHNQFRTRFRL
jgi:hypothetical protein